MEAKSKVHVVGPTEGTLVDTAGDRYRFLAMREVTGGKYGLLEATVPPGGGPPPHVHSREDEGFYVVDGEVTVYANDQKIVAGPGSFVHLPAYSRHWFRNESDRTVKMLVFIAPGGMEQMFLLTGQVARAPEQPIAPPTQNEKQKLLETAPSFGIEILLPDPV